jgi:hypothetical protein
MNSQKENKEKIKVKNRININILKKANNQNMLNQDKAEAKK